jgi:hypothetical protein
MLCKNSSSAVFDAANAVDPREMPHRLSVAIAPFVMGYRASFFTALVPQLQLWDLHWLMFVKPVGDLLSRVLSVLHLKSSKDSCVWMTSTRIRSASLLLQVPWV